MTNMQAAIGLSRIDKLDEIRALRKKQMDIYYNAISNVNGISLRKYTNWCDPVHWLMTISLDGKYDRYDFLLFMKNKGIDCRQMINPVHKAAHFINLYDGEFTVATNISKQSVHLPSGAALSKEIRNYIVKTIRNYLGN